MFGTATVVSIIVMPGLASGQEQTGMDLQPADAALDIELDPGAAPRSYLGDPPAISRAIGLGRTSVKPRDAEHQAISETDAFSSTNASSASTQRSDEKASPGDARSMKGRFWFLCVTMGLFASLAGNAFFGWVAWDTHTRYQDLVDDFHEAELRLKRQQRRPHSEEARSRDDLTQRDAT